MNRIEKFGIMWMTSVCASVLLVAPPPAQAEECSNQFAIDACTALCSAAEGTCSAVCGAAQATCEGLCNAAEGVCGGLCGAAIAVCKVGCDGIYGTCDLGCDACDVGCDICCPSCCCDIGFGEVCSPDFCGGGCGSCRSTCSSCHSGCSNTRTSCKNGCDGDCSGCQISCEDDCETDCSGCVFSCEDGCDDLCIPFKKIGESCIPLVEPCDAGLVCWPNAFDGNIFQCFPDESDELFDDEFCLAMYSPALHNGAMNVLGLSQTYGAGDSASLVASIVLEAGTVYGRDGCYGCYLATCIGLETNLQASVFASVGFFDTDIDGVKGQSRMIVESAGVELISFATSQVFSAPDFTELIGTTDALSFGVGISPISVGVYDCETIVDRVGCLDSSGNLVVFENNPPTAACSNVATCAGAVTCTAGADIDNGSFDPDGDSIFFSQSPASPYGIGVRTVTLTVTDTDEESDTCTAQVTVNDCTDPVITCPPPTPAECQSAGQALVDPGNATATDCTAVTVTDPGTSSYPLGTTTVNYTATDSAGNTSTCSTTVTVVDTTDPVLSGVPGNVTVECDSVPEPASPTATDICDTDVDISFTEVRTDGPCTDTYTLTRTWTAVDDSLNSTSGTQIITVQDTTDPVLSGVPGNVTVECDSVPEPASPTATDNCDGDVDISFSEVRTDGPCADTYTLTRTWTATDNCGNSSSGTQIVKVQDTTNPMLHGIPGDVTVECDSVPEPASPTATDNCDDDVEIAYSQVRTDGPCPSTYTLTRTWTATDNCNNGSGSETQTITVQDTTDPVIFCNAPETIVPPDPPVSFTATATDNCCDDVFVEITAVECFKFTKKGKRIDLGNGCRADFEGGTLTIRNSGGVDSHIAWNVHAVDCCGNESETTCEIVVANPGQGH